MRDALFTLKTAPGQDPAIDDWLFHQPDALRAIARELIETIRALAPDARETMHDGFPTWCLEDAAFVYVAAFRAHVNLGFFHGADLPDPGRRLTGSGKRMRHVKLKTLEDVAATGAAALIREARDDMRRRLAELRGNGEA